MVTGTLCGGEIQGKFAQKEMNCLQCEVYQLYNLRTGSDRVDLVTEQKEEVEHYRESASTAIEQQGPEVTLKALTASMDRTLEERIQERTRELVEANESLRREIEDRKRIEIQILHMAYHDALTDLPNRMLLERRLAEEIGRTERKDLKLAVLFIDLDRFKTINDMLGYAMGDGLLVAVAQRLKENLRSYDVVARLGSDEFVVVLSEVKTEHDVARLARRVLERLKAPFHLGGRKLYITPSMGIAVYPADGNDAQKLLKNADCAMYQAKALGRNNYLYYEPAMNTRAAEQAKLEIALAEAVERKELILEYQPQINLKTNAIVGMEALLRWLHPEMGLIAPRDFIPLAEETGLIIPIGESGQSGSGLHR